MADYGSSGGSAADPSDDVPRWPAANPTPSPSEPSGDSEAQPDATDASTEASGEQEQHGAADSAVPTWWSGRVEPDSESRTVEPAAGEHDTTSADADQVSPFDPSPDAGNPEQPAAAHVWSSASIPTSHDVDQPGDSHGSADAGSTDVGHTARHAAPERSEPAQPGTDEPEPATGVLPQQPEASDADEDAERAPDADDTEDEDDVRPVASPAPQAEASDEPPEAQTEPVPGPITPSEPGTPADPDPSQPTAPDPGDPGLPGPGPDQPTPTSPPAGPAPSDPGFPGPAPEGPLPMAGTGSAASSVDQPRRPAAQRGSLTIDDKVVSKIAAIAVQRISDISTASSGLARLTGIGDNATKATVAGTQVRVQVHVAVPWPQSVGQAAARVRTTVAGEIGRLTGLNVDGVDVHAEMGEPVTEPEPRRVH